MELRFESERSVEVNSIDVVRTSILQSLLRETDSPMGLKIFHQTKDMSIT